MLAKNTGFRRFWPNKVVLVNFGRNTGFGRFWPKNVVMVDSGSFWVVGGFLMSLLDSETGILGFFRLVCTEIRTSDLHRESWVSCHCTTCPAADSQKLSPVKPIYYWGGRPLGTKPSEVAIVQNLRNGLLVPMSETFPENSPVAPSYGQKSAPWGGMGVKHRTSPPAKI